MSLIERLGIPGDALAKEVAVITGAGRGIGRATATLFADLGARVVIADISDSGADTARAIRDGAREALFVKADVSSEEDVLALAEQAEQAFGTVTVLINNAIYCPVASVLEMDVSTWDRVMAVNLRGAFLTCRAFLPGMINRRHGTIINLISADAIPHLSAYATSKLGLVAFSQSLAAEVGDAGTRVVAFGPGFVDTPGLREAARSLAPRMGMDPDQFMAMSMHPAYQGAMPPEHVAAALAYLVAVLADEYQGDQTDAYAVLERAGLFAAQPESAVPAPGAGPIAGAGSAGGVARGLAQAFDLAGRLQAAIGETKAEFDRMPIFVRPMIRKAFSAKAGQAIQEWVETASRLHDGLARAYDGHATALDDLRHQRPRLQALLRQLAGYYQAVPGESSRFIKDPNQIREITRTMAEREELASSLARVLQDI